MVAAGKIKFKYRLKTMNTAVGEEGRVECSSANDIPGRILLGAPVVGSTIGIDVVGAGVFGTSVVGAAVAVGVGSAPTRNAPMTRHNSKAFVTLNRDMTKAGEIN